MTLKHPPTIDQCKVPRCSRLAGLTYLDLDICEHHWDLHCQGKINLRKYTKPLKTQRLVNSVRTE